MKEKVLVALSGGIDSAATVLMLRERGFEVMGLYIDMLGDEAARQKAATTAKMLQIEVLIEDVAEEFREKIINHTLSEHQAGRTPSPCVRCNPMIKWEVLVRVADRLGIVNIATGHYVRIVDSMVYRGVDPAKDQSYYLWALPMDILRRALTPLGDYTKAEVRLFLKRYEGFESLAAGGESMSICFIGRTPYNEFLGARLSLHKGDVVDARGDVVGEHDGYQLYTIGQKRGFSGGGAVVGVDPRRNFVVVSADSADLYCGQIIVTDWVLSDFDMEKEKIDVNVRGLGRNPVSGVKSIAELPDGTLEITLNESDAWAVAQGQPVVLYAGDKVVGGGIVCSKK